MVDSLNPNLTESSDKGSSDGSTESSQHRTDVEDAEKRLQETEACLTTGQPVTMEATKAFLVGFADLFKG